MRALIGALTTDRQVSFAEGLRAGDGYAAALLERGCALLTKPRRECVKMFLAEGMTFDEIAARTGYLTADVPLHIAAGIRALVPDGDARTARGVSQDVDIMQEECVGDPTEDGNDDRDNGYDGLPLSEFRCDDMENERHSLLFPANGRLVGDGDSGRARRIGDDRPEHIRRIGDGRQRRARRRRLWPWIIAVVVVVAVGACVYYIYGMDKAAHITVSDHARSIFGKNAHDRSVSERSAAGRYAHDKSATELSVQRSTDENSVHENPAAVSSAHDDASFDKPAVGNQPTEDSGAAGYAAEQYSVTDAIAESRGEATPPVRDTTAVAGRVSMTAVSEGSSPLIGRRKYDEYLAGAATPVEGGSRGEVTMIFTVNKYGRPSQIRVMSGPTHEANQEAIRLVSGGPEWSESPLPVTITIKFD